MSNEMTYRRLIFDVACHGEYEELMPAVLTTMGAVETPYIGGSGIMIIGMDEKPMVFEEMPDIPLVVNADVFEFPATFGSETEEEDGNR